MYFQHFLKILYYIHPSVHHFSGPGCSGRVRTPMRPFPWPLPLAHPGESKGVSRPAERFLHLPWGLFPDGHAGTPPPKGVQNASLPDA